MTGAVTYLKEYETSRQRKVLPTMATVDGLQRLYSTDLTPFVMLRSLGLQTVNALKPLKVGLEDLNGELYNGHSYKVISHLIPVVDLIFSKMCSVYLH